MRQLNRKLYKKNKTHIILAIFIAVCMLFSTFDPIRREISNLTRTDTLIISDVKSAAPLESDLPWVGVADDKTVHTYIQNSSSLTGQTDSFIITNPSQVNQSKIYSANLNFSFESEYNTNYTIEQDNPLNYPLSVKSSRDPYPSPVLDTINNITGEMTNPIGNLYDNDMGSYVRFLSSILAEISFNYTADFSTVSGFNKDDIAGFRLKFDKYIPLETSLDLYVYNFITDSWDLVKGNVIWDADTGAQSQEILIYENMRNMYFNNQDQMIFRLDLSGATQFILNIYKLAVEAVTVNELIITDTNHVALEFDLKSAATVYGFHSWIRTLDPNPPSIDLNISLYRANSTAKRIDVTDSAKFVLEPSGTLISSQIISGYTGDSYAYIPFYSNNSGIALNLSNYFVVIHTNSADANYSIVGLPWNGPNGVDPENKIEHLLLSSTDSGNTWDPALSSNSYQLDCAPFAINLTRPWKPSDIEMKVDNRTINDVIISTGIYESSSSLSWGIGNWIGVFDEKIIDIAGDITIPLTWDDTLTSSINFNVTYDVIIISIEDAIANYNASHGERINWDLNYDLDNSIYDNWNVKNFSFVVPTTWTVEESYAKNPFGSNISANIITNVEDMWSEYVYDHDTITFGGNGIYLFECTSPNHIYEISPLLSYLDGNSEYYWPTRALMPGDNMSITVKIQNFTDPESQVYMGSAECELYDIDGLKIDYATLMDSQIDDNESGIIDQFISIYEFDNSLVLNTTTDSVMGAYSLVLKWSNGEEIGFDKINIFITEYSSQINGLTPVTSDEDEDKIVNRLESFIHKNATDVQNYDVYIFSVNETGIIISENETLYHNDLNQLIDEEGVWLNITSVTANETLLNPGENVEINITLDSYNDFIGNDVKVEAKFVQSANNEWIVINQTSPEVFINKTGSHNQESEFSFDFTIPMDYRGLNAPIRHNPLQLQFSVWIKDTVGDFVNVKELTLNDLFPLVNFTETQFEGDVLGFSHLLKSTSANPTELILREIEREGTNIPGVTSYIIQIADSYFISSNNTEKYDYLATSFTKFENIVASDVVWGKTYEITGNLTDEFGIPMAGKSVSVKVLVDDIWINYNTFGSDDNTLITNSQGYFEGTFNTLTISKNDILKVNLNWDSSGDINHEDGNYTTIIDYSMYQSNVSVIILNSTDQPHLIKGQMNNLHFIINNQGNTSLQYIDINFVMEGVTGYIGLLNNSGYNMFVQGTTISISYDVDIPTVYEGDTATINVTITGISLESNELYNQTYVFEIVLLNFQVSNFNQGLIVFIIIGIIVLWGVGFLYARRIYNKIQGVPEETSTKTRRQRFIEVARLSRSKKEEPEVVEIPEKEEEIQESADLDELLKEEGLDEEK